jgi:hypothetical protein
VLVLLVLQLLLVLLLLQVLLLRLLLQLRLLLAARVAELEAPHAQRPVRKHAARSP